jgi:hypothetical protein
LNKLPILKLYKNGIVGDDKLKTSYEIVSKEYDMIMDELFDGLVDNVKEVNG